MQLEPGELEHVLEVWPVARLASLSGQRPQIVPIVFVPIGQAIFSPIDGKPKRTQHLQRIRNVARNETVSLLLDHYDTDWHALWWLRIDGAAAVVDADKLPSSERQRIEAAFRRKYPQYEQMPVFRDPATLIRIAPEGHVAWSARPIAWELLKSIS